MQRLTISMDNELAQDFDELMCRKGYANRSEAFRDMLRRELGEMTQEQDKHGPGRSVRRIGDGANGRETRPAQPDTVLIFVR